MRRFLLDTGPAQDFINQRRGIRQRVDAERRLGNRCGLCTPGLGELWAGIEGSSTRAWNLQLLKMTLSKLPVWPYTDSAAQEFGRLSALLRSIGRQMQQIDVQIAAIAMTLGNCTVVTMDSDLAAVPGLNVENWALSP